MFGLSSLQQKAMRYDHLTIVYWLPPTTYGRPVLSLVGHAPLLRILPAARGASVNSRARDVAQRDRQGKGAELCGCESRAGEAQERAASWREWQSEGVTGERKDAKRTPAHPLAEVDSSEQKQFDFSASVPSWMEKERKQLCLPRRSVGNSKKWVFSTRSPVPEHPFIVD